MVKMTVDTLMAWRWTTFSWECGRKPWEVYMQHLCQKSVTRRNFALVFPIDVYPNGTVVSFSCPLFCSPTKEIPYDKAKRYLLIRKFDLNNWDQSWFGWTSVSLFTFPIFVFWASPNLHGCVFSCNGGTGCSGWYMLHDTWQSEQETSRGPSQPRGHAEGSRCLLTWCFHAVL